MPGRSAYRRHWSPRSRRDVPVGGTEIPTAIQFGFVDVEKPGVAADAPFPSGSRRSGCAAAELGHAAPSSASGRFSVGLNAARTRGRALSRAEPLAARRRPPACPKTAGDLAPSARSRLTLFLDGRAARARSALCFSGVSAPQPPRSGECHPSASSAGPSSRKSPIRLGARAARNRPSHAGRRVSADLFRVCAAGNLRPRLARVRGALSCAPRDRRAAVVTAPGRRRRGSRERVEDLVQEVYCRLLGGGGSGRPRQFRGSSEAQLMSYLQRVAVSVVIDASGATLAEKRLGRSSGRLERLEAAPPAGSHLDEDWTGRSTSGGASDAAAFWRSAVGRSATAQTRRRRESLGSRCSRAGAAARSPNGSAAGWVPLESTRSSTACGAIWWPESNCRGATSASRSPRPLSADRRGAPIDSLRSPGHEA